jgi:hypothetical protein
VSVASGCPTLRGEGEVPAWLWRLAVPTGVSLASVGRRIEALEAEPTVEPVEFVPEPESVAVGVEAFVYEFGFAIPDPEVEEFTYRPVICLGGLVPDVADRPAPQAQTMVEEAGLAAVIEGDPSGLVARIQPPSGSIWPLGWLVTLTAVPPPAGAAATGDGGADGRAPTGRAGTGGDGSQAESPGGVSDGDAGATAGPAPSDGEPGSPTETRGAVQRLLDGHPWAGVLGGIAVLAAAVAGTEPVLRRRRERRWLSRHLRLRAEPGTADPQLDRDPTAPAVHTVRLTPEPGQTQVTIEEGDRR